MSDNPRYAREIDHAIARIAVGRPARTALERAAAVVLACGDRALLSHASALALWELAPWPDRPEVTAPTRRNPHGVTTHRSRTLTPRDVRRRHGIPVTSPARTLLDMAPRLTRRQLTRAVNDALRAKLLRRVDLRELLARCGGHPGRSRLAPHARSEIGATASVLEDEFLAFCAAHDLPEPKVNHVLPGGREVDAYFPEERVIVEVDSWRFHHDRETFERDRIKDAAALSAGIVTVRVTSRRLETEPAAAAARLQAILAARRRRAA